MRADAQPIDQAVNWTLSPLDELRLMRAQFVHHAFAPHAHDYFVIGIIEEGVQTFKRGRTQHVTTPGKLILLNPGEDHTGEAAVPTGFAYRALYPSSVLLRRCAESFRAPAPDVPRLLGGTILDERLFHWLRQLHRASEHADSLLALEDHFTRFFTELLRHHGASESALLDSATTPQAIRRVCEYLETYYPDPITLATLAELVNITPYHLTRQFTKHVGLPPHRYLENVRIRHAERLLHSGMSIVDVAYATGFSGQSHLTRTFKRFIGTTPGAFINQRKIVQDTPSSPHDNGQNPLL